MQKLKIIFQTSIFLFLISFLTGCEKEDTASQTDDTAITVKFGMAEFEEFGDVLETRSIPPNQVYEQLLDSTKKTDIFVYTVVESVQSEKSVQTRAAMAQNTRFRMVVYNSNNEKVGDNQYAVSGSSYVLVSGEPLVLVPGTYKFVSYTFNKETVPLGDVIEVTNGDDFATCCLSKAITATDNIVPMSFKRQISQFRVTATASGFTNNTVSFTNATVDNLRRIGTWAVSSSSTDDMGLTISGTASLTCTNNTPYKVLPVSGNLSITLNNLVVDGVNRGNKTVSVPVNFAKNGNYRISISFSNGHNNENNTLNIFVLGTSMRFNGDYGVAEGTAYDIASGLPFSSGIEQPADGGEVTYIRLASQCSRIFENPEYFGKYATYTSMVGNFTSVRWWSASRPTDITEANLRKSKIDIIFYDSEHIVNVSKGGVPYVNLITPQIANEMYNYHRNNTNTGLLLISGNPSSYGPSSAIPNYFIQKYFGGNALNFDAIPSWLNVLFTSSAYDGNSVMGGAGDFVFTSGVFTSSAARTLGYGPIPQNTALQWQSHTDGANTAYHDAAFSTYMVLSTANAYVPGWFPVFYGQANMANPYVQNAQIDRNKAVLAYNPRARIIWTPGSSQWGYPDQSNCSYPYTAPYNSGEPYNFNSRTGGVLLSWMANKNPVMNTWLYNVRPAYIMPLYSTGSDNTNFGQVKRYGSRAIYGCIGHMIIKNDIGHHH